MISKLKILIRDQVQMVENFKANRIKSITKVNLENKMNRKVEITQLIRLAIGVCQRSIVH